jgi:hypothetical protein
MAGPSRLALISTGLGGIAAMRFRDRLTERAGRTGVHAMISTMRIAVRPLLIAVVLTFWAVSGPIGMAFDGCAMMGAMCEAPCGVSSYIVAPPFTGVDALQIVTSVVSHPVECAPTAAATPLDPPPKFALLSA